MTTPTLQPVGSVAAREPLSPRLSDGKPSGKVGCWNCGVDLTSLYPTVAITSTEGK